MNNTQLFLYALGWTLAGFFGWRAVYWKRRCKAVGKELLHVAQNQIQDAEFWKKELLHARLQAGQR